MADSGALWRKPGGGTYSHTHVRHTARTWELLGGNLVSTPWYEAFNSDEVRGPRPTTEAAEIKLRAERRAGPMLGAMRRVEARIGELLGPADAHGGKRIKGSSQHDDLHQETRRQFRALAWAVRRGVLAYEDDSDDSPLRDATAFPPRLEDLGIERTQSHRWQREASLPEAKGARAR